MLPAVTALRLESQLDALPLLLAGVAPDALARRPAPGEWSAQENLAHLARHHDVFLVRLRRILAEDGPDLGRYRAEEDPEWPAWRELPVEEALARLRARRAELVALVDALGPAELARAGRHPVLGPMTVPLWLEFLLLHEAHHLYVIFGLVRRPSDPASRR
jgi:hypothetical protein